jgi:hypothetical protein
MVTADRVATQTGPMRRDQRAVFIDLDFASGDARFNRLNRLVGGRR